MATTYRPRPTTKISESPENSSDGAVCSEFSEFLDTRFGDNVGIYAITILPLCHYPEAWRTICEIGLMITLLSVYGLESFFNLIYS
jgi:hypothetical protein